MDAAARRASLVHARRLGPGLSELVAVDGVDFDVERGESFVPRPNGAVARRQRSE